MNTKKLVVLALLVGMGTALHTVIPPVLLGIKPDMMLTMLFLGILMFHDKKVALLLGIVAGILSAMTTGFPGGQIPNIVDKLVSAFVFYGMVSVFKGAIQSVSLAMVLTSVGTVVSGSVFLGSAYLLFGLPGSFVGLFAAAVLPAIVLNAGMMLILHPVAMNLLKRTKVSEAI